MRWPTPVTRLIDAIARPLGADPAHGIHVRQIDVSCIAGDSSDTVIVTYAFEHAMPMTGKVVSLDVSACPLRLVHARGSGCRVLGPVRFDGGQVLLCHLLSGQDWCGATVELRLAWPARSMNTSSPRVLVCPDMLPTLVNDRFDASRWPQPVLRYGGDGEPAAFVRASADANSALRQLVIYRGDRPGVVVRAGPLFAVELGAGLTDLGDAGAARVTSLLADIKTFLAADLRYDVNARLLALAVERSTGDPVLWGTPCLSESPSTYDLPNVARPNHATIGRALAGLWWTSGCRLVGENAFELSFAICGALGLRWTAHVDAARAAGFAEGYLSQSRDVQRSRPARLGWRWLLALYESLRRHEAVADTLHRLTVDNYGYYVPTHEVRARLVGVGVPLDSDDATVRIDSPIQDKL